MNETPKADRFLVIVLGKCYLVTVEKQTNLGGLSQDPYFAAAEIIVGEVLSPMFEDISGEWLSFESTGENDEFVTQRLMMESIANEEDVVLVMDYPEFPFYHDELNEHYNSSIVNIKRFSYGAILHDLGMMFQIDDIEEGEL